MTAIQTVIIDDERLSRQRLRRMLGEAPDFHIAAEFENANLSIDYLQNHPPDVLFLDVQMPGMDGFTLLETLDPEPAPIVIFVTAYNDYALRAFDVNAFDYLLKPFDQPRSRRLLMALLYPVQ